MSDKRFPPPRAAWAWLCLALATIAPSWALDFPDVWEDPLSTRPPILKNGATLPGDDSPLPCPASKDFALPLALGEAVDLALCNNPQIQAAWADIKIEASGVGEARAAYLPTVNASLSRLNNHTTYPDTRLPGSRIWGTTRYLSLGWRLFDFGGRSARQEAAEQLLEAALAGHDATLQKALVEVVQNYFDALTAQSLLNSRTQVAAIAEQTLAASQQREAKGASPQGDTLQAAAALARAQLARQRAQGDYRKTLAVLAQAMGVPQQTRILLPDSLEAQPAAAQQELEAWIADTEQTHPAIIAARAKWAAAQKTVTATRSEGLPTLDFNANHYENGYPNQGLQATQSNITTVGVTLTIPFFEGFARTYKIRGAQAQVEQRAAELRNTTQQILTEVVRAYADAVSALGNLQSSEALLSASSAALASAQRRYDKGAADVLELLNAQSTLAEAGQERVRTLAEWRSSRLRLLANAGMLGRARLLAADPAPTAF